MEKKKITIPAPTDADGNDITTWALPEGAVARLGQGKVVTITFSPDEYYLAVGTAVGLWLYEVGNDGTGCAMGHGTRCIWSHFFAEWKMDRYRRLGWPHKGVGPTARFV